MNLKELPLNDEFAQCLRSMRKKTKEYTDFRIKEISSCNHLFVKIKEGVSYPGFHSSDYEYDPSQVECVFCGLTNKHKYMEDLFYRHDLVEPWLYDRQSLETSFFNNYFRDYFRRSGKSFDESCFNLISDGIISSYHPGLLYQIAVRINPDANNEEIVEIMKKLNELETNEEKMKLRTIDHAENLIERYIKNKGKVLLKTN